MNHYDSKKRNIVVIICPGCFMCKDAKSFVGISERLFKKYDVMTMDFRGHGRSTGLFTFTAKEYHDLKVVVDFARKQYQVIGIVGFSLGAATALIYASKYKNINSIIAVSAPADFDKIENHFWDKDAVISAIERFEIGKAPCIRPGNLFLKKIKPIEVIDNVGPVPILFIAGRRDPIVYPWHNRKLYNKANKPKSVVYFDDGFHAEELYIKSKLKFLSVCNDWFAKTLSEQK